ncbi:hypothetical protein KFK09_013458 [Dendrobium nobile]|uniref:Uncharacterized protein n=1 Tax=Dendrobium nobile TaxID=94219 RepID=A0A8T3BA84_DENNO|nr:hypothetical protein KFK09_013458 [Dendrobium nobile]
MRKTHACHHSLLSHERNHVRMGKMFGTGLLYALMPLGDEDNLIPLYLRVLQALKWLI